MGSAAHVLELFPAVYRARERGKLLSEVVECLALPLEEAEAHLLRIQRAHRLPVAEQTADIVRLAGALNLGAYHFEDLLENPAIDYARKLALMRARVQRV